MRQSYTVLVVEDNQDIAIQLCNSLAEKGFVVDYSSSGQAALNLIKEQLYDIIILDLMLPDMDGLTVCLRIKEMVEINIPILMLTAKDSLQEKLAGFHAGADDYLTKPFALEEVYMRCIALTKRHQLHQSKIVKIGELVIDFNKHLIKRGENNISLSSIDYSILKILAEAYPNAVSKRHIAIKIWGDEQPETDAVRSHIYTLRCAIDKPFEYPIIKTVHGIGFRLEPKNER